MSTSTELLKQHWFGEIGILESHFESASVAVTAHAKSLVGYSGAIAFHHQKSWVLSLPAGMVDSVRRKILGQSTAELFNVVGLSRLFGHSVESIIGPAWVGKIEHKDFKACHTGNGRLLRSTDWTDFDKFLRQSNKTEVEHSALASKREPTVGVFHNGRIVAAASYEILEGAVAHIGVLSSKEFRGKGFAKEAVRLITEIALSRNIGIQYQTLKENLPSVSVAQSLGFTEFAETLAVRLRSLT